MATEPKQKLTFEQAMKRLEELVSRIEQGQTPLEQSIEMYAEGVKLIDRCRGILEEAEKKIQVLSKGKGGTLEVSGQMDEPQDNPSA